MGKFSRLGVQSRLLPLRLHLFLHRKHQWLLSRSSNTGTYPLPY